MTLSISRDASGLYRWYAFPAATAYLNRSKEIDSVRLFDNFIERIARGAKYPYLTFWHQGPDFKMGQADMIDRDGKCLILSGTWDDTPIARAARSGIESSPKGYWGTSIRYWAYKAENMIILRAGKTIHSPVYTEGELAEVSILPEDVAAGLKTQIVTRSIPPAQRPSRIILRGGPGSGNFGHAGIPGQIGGSAPGGGGGNVSGDTSSQNFKTYSTDSPDFPTEIMNQKWYMGFDANSYEKSAQLDTANGSVIAKFTVKPDKTGQYYISARIRDVETDEIVDSFSNDVPGSGIGAAKNADFDIEKWAKDWLELPEDVAAGLETQIVTRSIPPATTPSPSASASTTLSKMRSVRDTRFVLRGGEGSGNFGHKGVPGEVGGSASGNSSGETASPDKPKRFQDPENVFGKVHDASTGILSASSSRDKYGLEFSITPKATLNQAGVDDLYRDTHRMLEDSGWSIEKRGTPFNDVPGSSITAIGPGGNRTWSSYATHPNIPIPYELLVDSNGSHFKALGSTRS